MLPTGRPTTIAAMRGGRTYVLAAALLGAAALLTIAGVGDRSGFPDWQAFVLGVVQEVPPYREHRPQVQRDIERVVEVVVLLEVRPIPEPWDQHEMSG